MESLIFFAVLISGFATASEAKRCVEIFPDYKYLQSLRDHNYFYNPRISDLMERVRSLGVRFEFWDPTEGGTVTMRNRFVEPLIITSFYDQRFIAEYTFIYLPYEPQQLFGKLDSNYRTRQMLIRVARVFELQKKGVLFSPTSLELNGRISITGFAPVLRIEDLTLSAISHLFTEFKYRKVSFEPRESQWELWDFTPERNYVTSFQDGEELIIRMAYFEREELWEYIAHDLEQKLFAPAFRSLHRNPDEPIN